MTSKRPSLPANDLERSAMPTALEVAFFGDSGTLTWLRWFFIHWTIAGAAAESRICSTIPRRSQRFVPHGTHLGGSAYLPGFILGLARLMLWRGLLGRRGVAFCCYDASLSCDRVFGGSAEEQSSQGVGLRLELELKIACQEGNVLSYGE